MSKAHFVISYMTVKAHRHKQRWAFETRRFVITIIQAVLRQLVWNYILELNPQVL